MPLVVIRNDKTTEEYGIDSADFRRAQQYRDPKSGELVSYADAGFRIISMADGSAYQPPAERKPAEG